MDEGELLAQVGWVRSLARTLAVDAHDADDLAQDALVVALSASRPGETTSRQWLSGVLRKLLHTTRRGERRRLDREQRQPIASGPGSASPATSDLVERAACQRALVGAVLELDEPYRATLLQRFFEELSNEEIARRSGVPASTVATRVARGLERLRARLDAEGGARRWFSLVLPLVRWEKGSSATLPATTAGVLLVATSTKLLIGATVLLGALALYRVQSGEPREPAGSALEAPVAGAVGALDPTRPAGPGAEVSRVPLDVSVAEPSTVEGEIATPIAGAASARGRVLDVSAKPVAGVTVQRLRQKMGPTFEYEPAPGETLVSGVDGTFDFDPDPPGLFVVTDDVFATVLAGPILRLAGEAGEPVVVVAPRIPVAGVVVDTSGVPVEGADLWVNASPNARGTLGAAIEATQALPNHATSDAQGRFEFDEVGDVETTRLMVSATGFPGTTLPVPRGGDAALRVVLEAGPYGSTAVHGRVLRADGRPAAGAWVSAGLVAVRAGANGEFVVDTSGPGVFELDESAPVTLVAVAEGVGATKLVLAPLSEREQWPDPIVLVLDEAFLTIRGRVVDETGAPVGGVRVRVANSTPLGMIPTAPGAQNFFRTSVEELAGGGAERTALSPHESAASHAMDGRFTLRGLMNRDYDLEACLERKLLVASAGPIRAGAEGVELVLDRSALGRIAGRVVDSTGRGILGVSVSTARRQVDGESMGGFEFGLAVTTDADGAFALEDVATRGVFLRLIGESILPELERELPAGADVEDLVLPVGRRCRVVFDWGDWRGRADSARLLDGVGKPLVMMNLRGRSIGPREEIEVSDGPSPMLAASDAAATVVLSKNGEEVGRVPIRLVPGEAQTIEL